MSFQTSVITSVAAGVPGQIADDNPVELDTYACEDATLAFGVVVKRGTADGQCTVGGDATSVGVTVCVNKEKESDGSTTRYNQYEDVTVMVSGRMWVTMGSAGAAGAALFYNDTTGVIEAGTASTGETQLPTGSVLLTDSAASGSLAKIKVVNAIVG